MGREWLSFLCRLGWHRYQVVEIVRVSLWSGTVCYWGRCCCCGDEGLVWD
jgi:hypothetical protein